MSCQAKGSEALSHAQTCDSTSETVLVGGQGFACFEASLAEKKNKQKSATPPKKKSWVWKGFICFEGFHRGGWGRLRNEKGLGSFRAFYGLWGINH